MRGSWLLSHLRCHFACGDGWSEGHFAGLMVQLLCQRPDFVGRRCQRRGGLCVPAAEACVAAAEACKSSWTSLVYFFYVVASLMDVSWQAAAFVDHVASGALTSEFAAERQRLEGRIERLRAQHTDAVRASQLRKTRAVGW
jgi:hypothetical protein